MIVASPCTGVCKFDTPTGWCLGCGRTGEEMRDWHATSDVDRREIWDQIPARLHQLGVTCRRLPWTMDDVRHFVVSTLQSGRGTWVIGVVGAVAEFRAAEDEAVQVRAEGDDIIAFTRNGAMRVTLNDDVRAVTFDPPGLTGAPRIILAVKRERRRLPRAKVVTDLGLDTTALRPDANAALYDLGLGRKEARFCVRLGRGEAQKALDCATGLTLMQALPKLAGPLIAESPTRVVESALGRIEVEGQIPPPDATSPDGPHTHLLPEHLATGRALPVGMDLPRAYLPGAIFYPPK